MTSLAWTRSLGAELRAMTGVSVVALMQWRRATTNCPSTPTKGTLEMKLCCCTLSMFTILLLQLGAFNIKASRWQLQQWFLLEQLLLSSTMFSSKSAQVPVIFLNIRAWFNSSGLLIELWAQTTRGAPGWISISFTSPPQICDHGASFMSDRYFRGEELVSCGIKVTFCNASL